MSIPSSPYVGLEPYSVADEPYFFGRDKERRTIAFNLRGSRLTLLYGPSGVGKTSVLSAGVSHDLHQLAIENVRAYDTPEFVVVMFSSWQDDPLSALIANISKSARVFLPDGVLNPNEASLVKNIENWSKTLNSDFLIILDQFEDYFPHDKSKDSLLFAKELSDAVNSAALRANFLISIREDALSKLDVFKAQMPGLFDNYLRIERLRTKAAHEAIRNPVDVYNIKTHADPAYQVETKLVNEVSRQIVVRQTHSGRMARNIEKGVASLQEDSPIEAPLLQMVMKRLWEEEILLKSHVLRLATLERLGNTEAIVKNHLDIQMEKLSDGEKQVAAAIFYHLVTPSGWKIAHTVKDLAEYTHRSEAVLEPVLERLANARILRKVPYTLQSYSVARFEIFHEVFASAVLNWFSRYTLDKETEAERARLEEQVLLLRLKEKKIHAKSRRAIVFSCLAVALALAFLFLYAYGLRQKRKAERAEAQAKQERINTEQQVYFRNQLENEIPFFHSVMRGHTAAVNKAIFSPLENVVATISEDGTARLWNASTGVQLRQINLDLPLNDIAFNPKGTMLAVASASHITLWNPTNGNSETLSGHTANIRRVAFSLTDERFLASGDADGISIIWDVNEKREVQRPSRHIGQINDLEWSSQGPQLVTAGVDSAVLLWDASTGTSGPEIRHDNSHPLMPAFRPVNTAVFSPDGKEILTAGDDWTAKIWNSKTGEFIRVLRGHSGPVYSAEFARNGQTIVTASADRTARLWDITRREQFPVLAGHSEEVLGAHFSLDYTTVITWSKDRTSRVWDAVSGRFLLELKAHIRPVMSAEFSQNGRRVVTASADYTARVWAVSEARTLKITDARVSVDPVNYSGSCPTFVRVFGRISVEGVPATLRYRFILNGNRGPEHSLEFEEPGAKEVGGTYNFDRNMAGAVYLEITSPKNLPAGNLKSQTARFRVRCDPTPVDEKKSSPEPNP